MGKKVEYCDVCNQNKEEVITKRFFKSFKGVCPFCREELKWATEVVKIGTDWLVVDKPEKLAKFNKISVTPLVSMTLIILSIFL